ncbi:hypothetical protein GNP80_04280 [Aliivibrio fischeri]|uniref:hypothetical protein n=1 Tax=Aliivibrio fischeri TaxID=668 RepID=UPI0012D8FA7C|nr:hypothetical protein [Aliivibrio fischeri]MUK91660.1 hypothetical protein [Aliivibrio fischeri]
MATPQIKILGSLFATLFLFIINNNIFMKLTIPVKALYCIAFILVILPLIFWAIFFHQYNLSYDTNQWANFGSFIGGTVTPILTMISVIAIIFTIYYQRKQLEHSIKDAKEQRREDAKKDLKQRKLEQERRDNQVYYQEAQQSLIRAHDTFFSTDNSNPKNRLTWLTTARNIITAQNLSKEITEGSLIQSYKAFEEDIRTKFYIKTDYNSLRGLFSQKQNFENIEPISIATVKRFIVGMEIDPLNEDHKFTDTELLEISKQVSSQGLKQYLDTLGYYQNKG